MSDILILAYGDGVLDACRFGEIDVDFQRFQAWRAGAPLSLTPREFSLLRYLVQRHGETIGRDELLRHVWGLTCYPLTRTVDNHVARLRQKIERNPAHPRHLLTVHRVGYRFVR